MASYCELGAELLPYSTVPGSQLVLYYVVQFNIILVQQSQSLYSSTVQPYSITVQYGHSREDRAPITYITRRVHVIAIGLAHASCARSWLQASA